MAGVPDLRFPVLPVPPPLPALGNAAAPAPAAAAVPSAAAALGADPGEAHVMDLTADLSAIMDVAAE